MCPIRVRNEYMSVTVLVLKGIITSVTCTYRNKSGTKHMLLSSMGELTEAPLQPVITLLKMRTCLPSLKSQIEKNLKSRVVYRIVCPGCNACYVGQTSRHLITWFKEHKYKRNQPVRAHFDKCTHCTPTFNDVKILASTSRSLMFLKKFLRFVNRTYFYIVYSITEDGCDIRNIFCF